MKTYGLAIAWNWEFDSDFISGIEWECKQRGISTYRVENSNLDQTVNEIKSGKISFQAFFDRATDSDTDFLKLVELLHEPETFLINPHNLLAHAIDKATMHLEFITHGLHVPNTIILPPFTQNKELKNININLEQLGIPFVIKPANTTGGGTGVIMDAKSLKEVEIGRQEHPEDKYLLQTKIIPKEINGRRGWFRVYCVFGKIIPCWWDDITHRYDTLSIEDEKKFILGELRNISRTIQEITKLDFFTSEIALPEEGTFTVVDYVNEVCDMRLQSKYENGAPDPIVHRIERIISEQVELYLRK